MEDWDNKNERDWYMKRKQDEMEWDMKRKMESMRSSAAVHSDYSFNPGNLKFIEVVAVLTIILGAAKLIGLY